MIFNRKSKNKNMNEESKQENKRAAGDEQVILEDVNPVSNEENIENPDEIKSRIEEDIKDVTVYCNFMRFFHTFILHLHLQKVHSPH